MKVISFDFYHNDHEEGLEPFYSEEMDSIPQIGASIEFEDITRFANNEGLELEIETYKVVDVKHNYFIDAGKQIEFVSVSIDTCYNISTK